MICQITLVTAARVSGRIRSEDRCGEPRKEGGKRKRINILKKQDAEKHTKKNLLWWTTKKKSIKKTKWKKKILGLHVNTRRWKRTKQHKQKPKKNKARAARSFGFELLSLPPFPTGFLPARAQQHGEHISPVVLDGRRRPLAAYSGRFVSSDSTAMVRRLGAT